jgi:hypothetical protein
MSQADPVPPAPPSERVPLRSNLLRLAVILALCLGVGALSLLIARRSAGRAVGDVVAAVEALDPGWEWEPIQARRPPVPDDQNGAHQVLAAHKLLPPGWMNYRDPDVRKKFGLTDDDADVLDEVLSPAATAPRLDDKHLKVLRAEVGRAGPALAAALKVADFPRGRLPIDWRANYFDSRFDDAQNARTVSALLGYAALVRAHDGDFRGACACARAGLHAARVLDDEPSLIAYLVRVALVQSALNGLQRTLALGRPAAADLAALAALIEHEDAEQPGLCLTGLRGERAGVHKMFQAYEAGAVTFADLLRVMEIDPGWAATLEPFTVQTVRQAHAAYLRHTTALIEVARLPAAEQAERYRQAVRDLQEDDKAVFARRLIPATERIVEARLRCQANLRCALAALAAERCRQEAGRWPEKLAELEPKYLKQVPADPFDGQPLRLRRLEDGLVIYSVGPDRKDDGGTLTRQNPYQEGTDVGFRMWDADRRGRAAPAK